MATTQTHSNIVYRRMQLPVRHTVDAQTPIRRPNAGWQHFRESSGLSLACGGSFAAVCLLIT